MLPFFFLSAFLEFFEGFGFGALLALAVFFGHVGSNDDHGEVGFGIFGMREFDKLLECVGVVRLNKELEGWWSGRGAVLW